MLDSTVVGLFCLTSFLLIITPGPNMIFIIAVSIGRGRRDGMISALGVDSGSIVHIAATAFGLSALIASSETAFHIIKYLGAIYLIYLGICAIKEPEEDMDGTRNLNLNRSRVYYKGVITNVLNPKAAIFFLAFFPQFVDVSKGSVTLQIISLGGLFVVIGLLVDFTVAILAGTAANWIKSHTNFQKIQKWISGCMLIFLGIGAALAGYVKL